MIYLLDVNVIIALIDPAHVHHHAAHEWFSAEGQSGWATCPITENAILRIVGNASYPNSPGSPAAVLPSLLSLRSLHQHHFWPDDISFVDTQIFDTTRLLTAGQVPDSYLLGLAKVHGARLATFDRQLVADATLDGARHIHLIS